MPIKRDEKIDVPTNDQTLSQIEGFLRSVNEGDEVAIQNTHGGILEYSITKMTSVKPPRLYTEQSGNYGGNSWYMKSGKSTRFPTGQARLFIPTEHVRRFVELHPRGVMTYRTHRPQ